MFYDKCHIRFHSYLLHTLKKLTHSQQMLSSHGDDVNTLNTNQHNLEFRVSSRISTSLSSSSSNHSMFSNNTRTMEEVWKDINLSTTNHHPATGVNGYRGFILQDFLGKPLITSNDTPTSVNVSSPPSPPPPMLLTLNSGPGDHITRNVGSTSVPFDQVLGSANSSYAGLGIGGMRVFPAVDRTGGDRRHKRMIKNRESAARSRARKQAYTNELENEVERLKVENAKLKRQQKQLQLATTAQMTKKGGLQRTSTAPF
ncbi:bZIP transcription factor 27-like [Bidens hawaiensis]|uniref:bZIP transcription factor 27-like n=1 Tax=Bidens hawaiensis TaxID=980011 RepID=UPI00404A402E